MSEIQRGMTCRATSVCVGLFNGIPINPSRSYVDGVDWVQEAEAVLAYRLARGRVRLLGCDVSGLTAAIGLAR
jgi:hypothetical protein